MAYFDHHMGRSLPLDLTIFWALQFCWRLWVDFFQPHHVQTALALGLFQALSDALVVAVSEAQMAALIFYQFHLWVSLMQTMFDMGRQGPQALKVFLCSCHLL
jgi:hypothetical protein